MKNHQNWHEFLEFGKKLADSAGQAILPYFRHTIEIEVKPARLWDPVTQADRVGEGVMRRLIEENYPDHGIVGEEYGEKPSRCGLTWFLDPIDGTRAFIIGMPSWTCLIGLYYEAIPVLGLVSQPFTDELFFGDLNGAWYQRHDVSYPLKVYDAPLREAKVGTTAPELYHTAEQRRWLVNLGKSVTLLRYGGDAYFYAMLAAGHLNLALDVGLKPHDIAALIPIIKGAGGVVSEMNGRNPSEGGDIIAASSQRLLEEALEMMKRSNLD